MVRPYRFAQSVCLDIRHELVELAALHEREELGQRMKIQREISECWRVVGSAGQKTDRELSMNKKVILRLVIALVGLAAISTVQLSCHPRTPAVEPRSQ